MISKVALIALTICILSGCAAPGIYKRAYEPEGVAAIEKLRPPRLKTIVIDPGHGGRSRGAAGSKGLKEKNVVLDIARKLEKLLNERRGYKVLLTRKGDYNVSLKERRGLAKRNGADLFISIHCDGNRNRRVNGTAVFVLSQKGVNITKERALTDGDFLVDPEDIAYDQNNRLNETLVDLIQTGTRQESCIFAELSLASITRELGTRNLGLKEANFAVLNMLDVPSVLVEVAFITNWWEEKLLRRPSVRRRVAKALRVAIEQYFRGIKE